MSLIESGWYQEGKRLGPMREHGRRRKFTRRDIFKHVGPAEERRALFEAFFHE